MNQEILKKLDELERKIESGEVSKEASTVKEWGGADVIISSQWNDNIKEWLGDQPLVVSLQKSEPKRRAVITEFAKELSWLFYQLRDTFTGEIDYISKYDFYGLLAQAAIDYLEKNKECVNCNQLLTSVLVKTRSLYKG